MGKVLRASILLGVALLIAGLGLTGTALADPGDEDPRGFIKVYVYRAGSPWAGVSVTVEAISSLTWVKVDDGSWLSLGWGTTATTTTDSSGVASFRIRRLCACHTAKVRITVQKDSYSETREEEVQIRLLRPPTNSFEFQYTPPGVPEFPYGLPIAMFLTAGLYLAISTKRRKGRITG